MFEYGENPIDILSPPLLHQPGGDDVVLTDPPKVNGAPIKKKIMVNTILYL